jgi:hypothetical protein
MIVGGSAAGSDGTRTTAPPVVPPVAAGCPAAAVRVAPDEMPVGLPDSETMTARMTRLQRDALLVGITVAVCAAIFTPLTFGGSGHASRTYKLKVGDYAYSPNAGVNCVDTLLTSSPISRPYARTLGRYAVECVALRSGLTYNTYISELGVVVERAYRAVFTRTNR